MIHWSWLIPAVLGGGLLAVGVLLFAVGRAARLEDDDG